MIRSSKHILMMTLAAAVLLSAGSVYAQQGEQIEGANLPQLAVSMERFDFGRVTQGSSISHAFWLKNVGGDTLKITDVKPG